jgi:hypothetical protein
MSLAVQPKTFSEGMHNLVQCWKMYVEKQVECVEKLYCIVYYYCVNFN